MKYREDNLPFDDTPCLIGIHKEAFGHGYEDVFDIADDHHYRTIVASLHLSKFEKAHRR